MNYDEYLLQRQYATDSRPVEERKIYLLFDEKKQLIYSDVNEEIVKTLKEENDEVGWVWYNDFDQYNIEKTYKLMNLCD